MRIQRRQSVGRRSPTKPALIRWRVELLLWRRPTRWRVAPVMPLIVWTCSILMNPSGLAHAQVLDNAKTPAPVVDQTSAADPKDSSYSGGVSGADMEHKFLKLLASKQSGGSQRDIPLDLDNAPQPSPLKLEDIDYIELVRQELSLDADQLEQLRSAGLLLRKLDGNYSFPAAYYTIYVRDLPLLVTTDSILHAVHRSFDSIIQETEQFVLKPTLQTALNKLRQQLAAISDEVSQANLNDVLRDVDLYLTVALNLTEGRPNRRSAASPSQTGQEAHVAELLQKIHAAKGLEELPLYGSTRMLDFSQFKPRGHYTTYQLRDYFLTMMWLGRSDCGWDVLAEDPADVRQLQNALLLNLLAETSTATQELKVIDDLLATFIGNSNGLSAPRLRQLMQSIEFTQVADIADPVKLAKLRTVLQALREKTLLVRTEAVRSHGKLETNPPFRFQMVGQRFALDSFILSRLVYDAIEVDGERPKRMMPQGLDVMASLGNSLAFALLGPELEKWRYWKDLATARQLVAELDNGFWKESFYNGWLNSLRQLNREFADYEQVPHALRTSTWQRKQLQTQLASWAELRRDTVLYVAQSLSQFDCEYPSAYVEPYPEFFANLREMIKRVAEYEYDTQAPAAVNNNRWGTNRIAGHKEFWLRMAGHLETLESIASKELHRAPLSPEELDFLDTTISRQGGVAVGSGLTRTIEYDGWYTELIYNFKGRAQEDAQPIIADVHTDSTHGQVLQAATGKTEICILVADNEQGCACAFVGPTYSYYEFTNSLANRLDDQQWRSRLANSATQELRPKWLDPITTQGSAPAIMLDPVTVERSGDHLIANVPGEGYQGTIGQVKVGLTDDGMKKLASLAPKLRWLNAADSEISDRGLEQLTALDNLKVVDLNNTRVTDVGLGRLLNSRYLRRLSVANTRLTDESLGTIANWRYLDQLDLRGTHITDAGLASLATLPYLRQLDICDTAITHGAVTELKSRLPKLNIRHD